MLYSTMYMYWVLIIVHVIIINMVVIYVHAYMQSSLFIYFSVAGVDDETGHARKCIKQQLNYITTVKK